jgi:hypothetical protein
MTFVVLFVGIVVIFAAMLYLTLAVNDFERKTKELGVLLEKRYTIIVPQKKKNESGPPGKPPAQLKT